MPQLDPTWFASQLFWLAITFVILYSVLKRFVLPPLQDIMAQRETTMSNDLETAQRCKDQAENARMEYERTLADSRALARGLVDEVIEGQKERAEAAGKMMDKQLATKLDDAMNRIHAKKQSMIEALAPATAELAGLIVQKLTQELPSTDQVAKALKEAKG
jgi:F-type H+-transporting ATPase subunit b